MNSALYVLKINTAQSSNSVSLCKLKDLNSYQAYVRLPFLLSFLDKICP